MAASQLEIPEHGPVTCQGYQVIIVYDEAMINVDAQPTKLRDAGKRMKSII